MISPITSLEAHAAIAGSFPIRALLFNINQSVDLDHVDQVDRIDYIDQRPEKVIL